MAQHLATTASSIVGSASHIPSLIAPSVVAPYLTTGRACTRLLGGVLLTLSVPLIAVLALLIRATSPGPILFRQERVGRGGRTFTMFKLRSMVDGAQGLRPAAWTCAADPRITPIGSRLRRWHLDELPQLWNVVRGEMALVGPRPERPEIAARLVDLVPGYELRQQVLPGIVGLAQINLPPDTSVDSVRKKLQLDLEYLRTAGPGLDLRMLAWSCARLLGVPFDLATRSLGLTREAAADPAPRSQCADPFRLV